MNTAPGDRRRDLAENGRPSHGPDPLVRVAIWATAMLLLAAHAGVVGADPLPQGTAEYQISYLGVDVARSRMQLSAGPGKRYHLHLRTQTEGAIEALYPLRHETETHLKLTAKNVRPIRFLWETRLWGPPERQTIRFNWRKRSARVDQDNEQYTRSLPRGPIQDRISLIPAVMYDLGNDRLRQTYTLFDGKRLREYPLRNTGRETIDTALGPLETVRVERPVADKNERTLIWLAPELGYLPVRIAHLSGQRQTLKVELISFQAKASH